MRKGHSALSDIFYSILAGGSKSFKQYLTRGGNKNIQCADGKSVLMHSIQTEDTDLFDLCLCKDVDINLIDSRENTVLHMAAISSNVYFLKCLLYKNIDLNCQNYQGNTPLMLAISNHQSATAIILIDIGCDVNIQNKDGNTALHTLIENNSELDPLHQNHEKFLLNSLISHNADWTLRNFSFAGGQTPLLCAAANKDIELVDFILSSCDLSQFSYDLLHLFEKKNVCYKETLLLKGVNPCTRSQQKHSVIGFVLKSGTLNDLYCIVQNYSLATSSSSDNELLEFGFGRETTLLPRNLIQMLLDCGLQLSFHSHFMNLPEKLQIELDEMVSNQKEPVTLMSQTRTLIRKCLRVQIQEKICLLPLPRKIKKYLLFFSELNPKYSYNVKRHFKSKMILN